MKAASAARQGLSRAATWPGPDEIDVVAFGMRWIGALPGGEHWASGRDAAAPAIHVRQGPVSMTGAHGEELWSGPDQGGEFRATRMPDGSVLMAHTTGGRFALDVSGAVLTVDPAGDPLITARVLLDSVMFTVALVRGIVMLHAAALSGPEGAIAIVGRSGDGKSSLAGAFRDRGMLSITDDVLALNVVEDRVMASPGPPVVTLPIIAAPRPEETPLALVDGERWSSVPVIPRPVPLTAVIELIDREVRRPGSAVVPLAEHMLSVPPEGARDRFVMLAELSARCASVQVVARSAPPEVIATDVLRQLNWSSSSHD